MNTHLYPLFITHYYTANADEDLQNIIKDNKGGLYKPGQIMVDKGPMAKHLLKEYARRLVLHYQDMDQLHPGPGPLKKLPSKNPTIEKLLKLLHEDYPPSAQEAPYLYQCWMKFKADIYDY
jgi:hypothetical protein